MTDAPFREQDVRWSDIGTHQDDNFIYRGHRCATWPLETSLERASKSLYESLGKATDMENTLFLEFRRRFHHYSANVPQPDQNLRWLSLMQNHGAPTRLLDWTFSIYVVSYFALEQATSDCAVWKIDKKWLKDEGQDLFRRISRMTEIFEDGNEEKVEEHFRNYVLNRPPVPATIQVNPFQLDERLTIQKGVFLFPCHAGETFETNLKAMPGFDDSSKVLKLTIKHGERRQALKTLHSMNVSRATLFPGLDGFAQSLKVSHPLL